MHMNSSKPSHFVWEVITPEKLRDWHLNQKTVHYKEHGCTLRVNKGSSTLKLQNYGYIRNGSIVVADSAALETALVLAEANETNDILTILHYRKSLECLLPILKIAVTAIAMQDGIFWQVGETLLPFSEYSSPSAVTKYLLEGASDQPVSKSFGFLTKPTFEKLKTMGCVDPIILKETHTWVDYEWHLHSSFIDLTVSGEWNEAHGRTEKYFVFPFETFEEALLIRDHILTSQWDRLLEYCIDISGLNYRFTATRRVTEATDLEIDLSDVPGHRGYWLSPSDHSIFLGGPRLETTVLEVKITADSLQQALKLAGEISQPSQPDFKLLTWSNISSMIEKCTAWSLTEQEVQIDYFNGMLTVKFFALNMYPTTFKLPVSERFDIELLKAWNQNAGSLKNERSLV